MNTKKKSTKDISNQIKSHVKCISSLLVGAGVASIMGNVMKEYKPDAKGIQKLIIKIGAVALTGMVIKSVNDYVDSEIDDIFESATEFAVRLDQEGERTDDDFDDQD